MKYAQLLILLAAATVTARAQGNEPAPRIVCAEPVYNFGAVDNSRDVEHTFVVSNAGQTTLQIIQVRPACGCTAANLSASEVPPGGTAEISTKLSLRGRSGPQNKPITVSSSDPANPQLMLRLEGTVVAEIEMRPSAVFFGSIPGTAMVTSAVEVVNNSQTPIRLGDLSVEPPLFTATAETVQDGRQYRIRLITQPPLPAGNVNATLSIKSDHPNHPVLTVPVSANATP